MSLLPLPPGGGSWYTEAMSITHHDKWKAEPLPDSLLWTLHFDGSCPLNPGPMGIGYTLSRAGHTVVRVGAQVGQGTNNVAEYQALLAGMRHALRIGMYRLRIVTDSQLVQMHYGRKWKARDGTLARLLREAHMLAACFLREPEMSHTFREDNAAADALSRELVHDSLPLPTPRQGRALLGWQAASLNVWWHYKGVRSSPILARVFGIQDTQVDQIVSGRSYSDVSFDGHPTWEEYRGVPAEFNGVALPAPRCQQESVR